MASDQDSSDSENGLPGTMIQSFIIKIWREEPEKGGRPKWRGHITHVPGNERRYLRSLDDIADFMRGYLQRMGVRMGCRWEWKHLLERRKFF